MEPTNNNPNINAYASNRTQLNQVRQQNILSSAQLLQLTSFNSQQLSEAIRLVASQLGISAVAARRVIQQLAVTGELKNLSNLKNLLSTKAPDLNKIIDQNRTQVATPQTEVTSTENQNNLQGLDRFKANTGEALALGKEVNIRNRPGLDRANNIPQSEEAMIFSQLVSSPKNFASWLVNNKAAFITLRDNPQLANLLMALSNDKVHMSPLMLSELAKLLSQLAKLKQSKTNAGDDSEAITEDRAYEATQAAMDRSSTVVSGVRDALDTVPVRSLRDFLLEAERFAEEEIANLWSLTLKRDKEVEQKILSQLISSKRRGARK